MQIQIQDAVSPHSNPKLRAPHPRISHLHVSALKANFNLNY